MYTLEIQEWVAEAKVDEKSTEPLLSSSFDEIRVEDSNMDVGQIIDSRHNSLQHRNGLTTSPM